jgi:L-serine dehydratase
MFLSVFDIFKLGVGPSSSHTMGPMVAGGRFLTMLRASLFHPHGLRVRLHGSLAFTGKGHATDRATILGLAGVLPESYDHAAAEAALAENRATGLLTPPGLAPLRFDPEHDLVFDFGPALPGHANGMVIEATDAQHDVILRETFYSIGGGFVLTQAEHAAVDDRALAAPSPVPFPFRTAAEMLTMAHAAGLTIAQMKHRNERRFRSDAEIAAGLDRVW